MQTKRRQVLETISLSIFSRVFRGAFEGLLRRLPLRRVEVVLDLAQREVDRRGDCWLTAHRRPKRTAGIRNRWLCPPDTPSPTPFALVVQGPLIHEEEFTLESVRLYRRNHAGTTVIVTTWTDSDPYYLDQIRATGAEVVLSDKPLKPGMWNVNYQIVSTRAGVARARALGAAYVLKTRSDQRLHAHNLGHSLQSLLGAFPVGTPGAQRARIAFASFGTRAFIPYHLSDQVVGGTLEDMELYWSAPLDTREGKVDLNATLGRLSTERLPAEVYLGANFLEKVGERLTHTIAHHWQAVAERFCVFDNSALDVFWPKYERFYEYRDCCYDRVITVQSLTFTDWLCLVNTHDSGFSAPEYFLDLGLSG